MSGRDTECAAFRMINRELAECTPGAGRARAIGRNHNLWSLLVKDLAMAENGLPGGVKAHLIGLGLWAMRYGPSFRPTKVAPSPAAPIRPQSGPDRAAVKRLSSLRAGSLPAHRG